MRFLLSVILTACLSLATVESRAAIVFADSFATDGPLIGANADIGGTWANVSAVIANPVQVVGGRVVISTSGQDVLAPFTSPISRVNGESVFMSQVINLSAAQANGDYFSHLSSTPTSFFSRLHARTSGSGFSLGIVSTSGTGAVLTYGSTALDFGVDYQVVTAWDFVAGASNDLFSIYVDPIDPTRANNTAYVSNVVWGSSSAEPTSFGFASIRQGGASNAPTLTLDNMIVATQFSDVVTAVPEPSSLAVLGLIGVAGAVVRRRRGIAAITE